jgi:hypothetical protein
MKSEYSVGDHVVYHKPKSSVHPGPRAEDIHPAEHGDDYSYLVDKYWTVSAIIDDETIEVTTRRGKRHQLRVDDPNLEKAGGLKHVLSKSKFPGLPGTDQEEEEGNTPA